MITQSEIFKFFKYCPLTGQLTRIAKINRHTGELYNCEILVENDNGSGYKRVFINGSRYLAHVVIFIYVTGRTPSAVDHVDGDKQNNKWANLREVDHDQNMVNKGVYVNSPFGFPGVSKSKDKFIAVVQKNKVRKWLGKFDTVDAAITAIKSFHEVSGFHQNHGARESWRK